MIEVTNATIYLSCYEYGPGVSKVIITLSCPVEKVHKEGTAIRTSQIDREITSIYLSNAKGDRVSSESSHITIELSQYYGLKGGCSPIYFNFSRFHNEWVTQFIVRGSLHITYNFSEINLKFERDCINNRICHDSEKFNARGTFSGDYINPSTKKTEKVSLMYAAYEPANLKEDGEKNPLIIWLHGQGEGGTDVEIAIVGNQVTSLAGEKIQSYFTTKNGSDGSYVLAIQCPTMWMDNGDNRNHNGDLDSRYTEILKDTIDHYLTIVNTDVDLNRIYIGGCSNGGYMSMNMIIKFPQMFAASYQTCEAHAFMVFERDNDGNYIHLKDNKSPTAVVKSDKRFFTDEKIEKIKNVPIWLIASNEDDTVLPSLFSLPTYKMFLKNGLKNVWFSFFKSVNGVDLPDMKYNGHWSWIRLFNDQVTHVQDREKIINSADDDESFGFVPDNNGGGCQNASDENGTYKSIFQWLNAQVKHY